MRPTFVVEVANPDLPKALIFHDSFTGYFTNYPAVHFKQSVYRWSYKVDWKVIDHEKLGVVILQILERRLDRIYLSQAE